MTECQNQTDFHIGSPQIVQQLRFKCLYDLVCRLEFENDQSIDNQVSMEGAYRHTVKPHWNRNFLLNLEASFSKRDQHGSPVNRLNKPITKLIRN